ncbi:MAG: C45 family autoproteolytic acyltransferase/hydrolase [Thermogutta sp.]
MATIVRGHRRMGFLAWLGLGVVLLTVSLPPTTPLTVSAEEGVFGPARTCDKGELRYVEGVPVFILRGTPEERGRQEAALALNVAGGMLLAPRNLLELMNYPGGWDAFLKKCRPYLARIPDHHRLEIEGMVAAADGRVEFEDIAAGNVIPDLYRSFACSSLAVLPEKSDDGKVRFGRNLDFFSVGVLDRLSVVKVYLPDEGEGKLRFASVGFPGMVGCLSGINEAGLALAVHEVYLSSDGSPLVAADAMPYTMMLREVLENCRNVEEAAEWLRNAARSTRLCIVTADPWRAQVVEFTPANLDVREPEGGILACTNHFRTPRLRSWTWCSRYPRLREAADRPQVSRAEIMHKLDEVNMRFLTVQSMVFEPEDRQLYLALGSPPVTRGPYRHVDLSPWLTGSQESSHAATLDLQAAKHRP